MDQEKQGNTEDKLPIEPLTMPPHDLVDVNTVAKQTDRHSRKECVADDISVDTQMETGTEQKHQPFQVEKPSDSEQHSEVDGVSTTDQHSNTETLSSQHQDKCEERSLSSITDRHEPMTDATVLKQNDDTELVKNVASAPKDFGKQSEEVSCSMDEPSTVHNNSAESAVKEQKNEVQSTSLPSSPASPSVSGQDSGLSQDDSSSDIPKSPVCSDITKQKGVDAEELREDEAGQISPQPIVARSDQSANGSHQQAVSPDTNTSVSETQVTVSDLDTPPASNTAASAKAAGDVGSAAAASSEQESVYYIKWIMFGQNNVPIITQNENGPCPLLAIMNVLLLKGKVKLAPMLEMITSEQLMTYLGECIFENMPKNLSETTQANYEQNMQDAMGVMYKLQTGLDVNVKFTGVGDFEFTPELIIFDLLEISLYHGWLVDPQDPQTVQAVNQCSYNQLVEKIISLKHSAKEEDVTLALVSEQFLDRSASQLTYHGLCELSSVVKESELCVFFRNNHFNTLYKQNNELFLLVTDQGFLTESNVVWETLSNVDGDCHFTDATFRTYTKPAPSAEPIPDPCVPVGSPEQIDHDYQVALFLQEEANQLQSPPWTGGFQQEHAAFAQADHEFAMRLQEEENRRALSDQQRQAAAAGGAAPPTGHPQPQGQGRPQGQGSAPESARRRGGERREKEEKSCTIL